MKSLAELRAVKEKALENMHGRQKGDADFTIIVGMGTCGIAAGARDTLKTVMDEIQKRELINKISVTQTGCAGFCNNEPMMEVKDQKGNSTVYQKVTSDKVKRIFDDHISKGIVVSEYVFNVTLKQ